MTILTEKESVAKNYAKALNLKKTAAGLYESTDGKIKLTYAAGHLYKLYDMADYDPQLKSWYCIKKLPYIPDEYKTKADDGEGKAKKGIRTSCEKYLREADRKGDEIVIATDPDREGEVIARFILDKIGVDYENVSRIWCCEGINRNEVIRGIKERKNDREYDVLFEKGFSQKKSDWVTGLNLTRLFTIIENDGTVWSIGRVQTAVLQELYDRHMAISLFVSHEYYEIKVTDSKGNEWWIDERSFEGKKVTDRKIAENILKKVQDGSVIKADDVRIEKEVKKAPLLYDSSSLAADSHILFGFDVDKTLAVSQSLYNEEGAVSYPRTSSRYLKEEDAELYGREYKEYLKAYGIEDRGYSLKKENSNVFNTKKCEGHHAIIPSKIWKGDGDRQKIYDLVMRSFLMAGMDDFEAEKKKCKGRCGNYEIFCEGKKITEEGWTRLDLHKKEKTRDIDVEEGKEYRIEKAEIMIKKTEPKKHYNQATLISWMKNPCGKDEQGDKIIGIGTQATQAGIIRTLFERNYIRTENRHIQITQRGIKLVEKIRDIPVIDRITRVETTTKWEKMNDEDPKRFLKETEETTRIIFRKMENEMNTMIEKKEAGNCPYCGGKIVQGKAGWYCSGYKEKGCKNSLSFNIMGNKIDEELVKKLLEEKKTDVMKGVKKDGSSCEFHIRIDESGCFSIVYTDSQEEVCKCPKCNSPVYKYAKVYKCSSRECDFFIWKKTSGIEIKAEDVENLSRGMSVSKVQVKKDGTTANVRIKMDDGMNNILMSYENQKN